MVNILVMVIIIVVVASIIMGIVWYAPFFPAQIKQWIIWIVGPLALLLIVLQFLGMAGVAVVH
jgi:hypothetical protein